MVQRYEQEQEWEQEQEQSAMYRRAFRRMGTVESDSLAVPSDISEEPVTKL